MKIALLGYGKMGKIIEKIAHDRKHEIVLKIDNNNLDELTTENLQKADVAIEFSTPATVLGNIESCFKAGVPIVVGTTGWHHEMEQIKEQCEYQKASFIYATNFSVGVNVFFHVNKILAKLMNNYPYYDVQVEEIHHTQKLDSPSGTAITIAEGIIDNLDSKKGWKNVVISDEKPDDETIAANDLLIESLRIENVPGTHTVIYDSEIDTIEFKHTAHNRNGFALGAVLAAEWIKDKKGFYSVEDMFDFNN
ncbi:MULTISPECIES: 4-hydroxy-tetrahydrodipicolinate reductase [unclassified Mucilaginibacter]|uniref:4-hydroxy-tetrahydrodipicolinate reductase n=1 Tax=unclassified Mucilaginibacter TaxID=2617802 RepID=UPI002AC98489|nr:MULTISPECIES: 4-hydroxy-tetrahydrodipicolinate reductase [unclassified Mucilaginibacter]MEB0249317.1 4-hydroxy-tetrahydrodipicolinate reductase [Mucilaginibacter sp. 5B2]MEB0261174.1 4-hydroxy-tetrahydrodipicolinate reductase [Mucilaginibacter sp. 10I4]MEB0280346.1 4-hydroxy-tetrahydrodipicolinate reductase [Mucilaginibacter sp. 10B2]MEB0300367.1 4-hydroxy-tetrahydrodipicolinate reductase [Mucilaginibacter sp. 5C4]WPX24563.1 4-hydroxy-tetrahydrodipicolinate reductase [Mucilaginibacter sp. 5